MNVQGLCQFTSKIHSQIIFKSFQTSCSKFSKMESVSMCLDPRQEALLKEPCILVDKNDKVVGQASKRDCHLLGEDGSLSPLHRAFSVFLFNNEGKLLLQQRSDYKITFPGYYTNTCCSHPLYIPSDMTERDAEGVRSAAQRRLNFELGIPMEQIDPKKFLYLTRILYASPSNGPWGEHELDYILFLKGDFDVVPNENEVKEIKYIEREKFQHFLDDLEKKNIPITPWFKLIVQTFLPKWWEDLDQIEKYTDQNTIHNMLK